MDRFHYIFDQLIIYEFSLTNFKTRSICVRCVYEGSDYCKKGENTNPAIMVLTGYDP